MSADTTVEDVQDPFEAQRPRMFAIAYRMLGSASDAEDIVQDAWLRWESADRDAVETPSAFLARVVMNLCLNALTSARARREVYVGPWLPEPVLTSSSGDGALGPLDDVAQRETVSFALLALLERLTPAERAAYVLREAFAYSHRDVAQILDTSEANARQLHARARRHLASDRTRPVEPARWKQLVEVFLAAARDGDVGRLEALLADDVVSRADGGGVVNAARRPVVGRERVARYLVGVLEKFGGGMVPYLAEANGEPVLVMMEGDTLAAVCFFELDGDVVASFDIAMNPEKIAFAAGQLSRTGGLPGGSLSTRRE